MKKKQLKNVTLLSLNLHNPIQAAKALVYSSREIDFGRIVLIAREKPDNLPKNIEFIKTDMDGREEASLFSYQVLPDLLKTDYMLGIHDDGFIINPHLWDDEFLKYDYIGAPWKNYGQINRVGNGGFVLKSNKFVQLTRNLKYLGKHEDGELTNDYYHHFVRCGCKYAPLSVAMRFSLESRIPECEYNLDKCFGFHGRGNPKDVTVHDGHYHQFQEKCKLLDSIEL